MLRPSRSLTHTLFQAGAVAALALPAFAQTSHNPNLRPVTSAVRDGGTLHVETGIWSRKSGAAALGGEVLYDNTCSSLYFGALSGDTYVDEGRIPGTSSPQNLSSQPGCATSYAVNGFQIGYCTDLPSASFTYAFYTNYAACSTVIGVTPAGSFALTGLPGSVAGVTHCWTVNLDMSSTPFVIDAGPTNPLFGLAVSSPQTTTLNQGPLIAGDGVSCTRWDGTSWDPVVNLAESGTGMGTLDQFRIESGPTTAGCYWFGGFPFASFWLELYGNTCAPDGTGQAAFCLPGAVGQNTCPCGNNPAPTAGGGCLNSFGTSARIAGSGTPSLANDTVVLSGTQMPPLSSVLYFQGTVRQSGGAGTVFGDGLRCAGGTVTRLGSMINSNTGASQYPSSPAQQSVSVRGGVAQPGTRTYQAWYRNVAPFCSAAQFNTSNGWEIAWGT